MLNMNDKIFSRKRFLIPKFKIFNHKKTRIKFGVSKLNVNNKNSQKTNGFNGKGLYNNYNKNETIRKFIKTSIVVIIAVLIANRIISAIEPTMNVLCINMAKSIATQISNEQATVVMANYKYEDLSSIIRDDQGNIKMINMNIAVVNEITSDVAIKIQKCLDNYQSGEFYIKLGSFTGTKILSGRGPNIPIKMATVGNVETDLVSKFTQAGINQTLHRIYVNVVCNVTILTPFDTIDQTITNQVLLAEAVIVGEIPNTYYNLNGLDNNDLMEVME